MFERNMTSVDLCGNRVVRNSRSDSSDNCGSLQQLGSTYLRSRFVPTMFHSVIRNPCLRLLICVLLQGVCAGTN
jgi:hypothetical protein